MKKIVFSLIIPVLMLSFCSCTKKEAPKEKTAETIVNTPAPAVQNYYSPFTGKETSLQEYNNMPFLMVVENSREARPQSGLNDADVIFETLAEGGIPRFMALYQSKKSPEIGPVRSARTYFLDIAKEYGVPFGHCGGNEDALDIIKKEHMLSLNEIAYGNYYWRDNKRKAPHNLYTSSEKVEELIAKNSYGGKSNTLLKFDSSYWKNASLNAASKVTLNFSSYYTTSYEFKNNAYEKFMDGKPALDKNDSSPLVADNLVVQVAKFSMKKGELGLDIKLIGEGDAYVISNGRYVKGKWFRKDVNSPTVIFDENNNIVPLNTGRTWWHIIDKASSVKIE